MVDKKIVLDTIKRMQGSGIDDETIKKTLKESGLTSAEINEYFSEVTGKPIEQVMPGGNEQESQPIDESLERNVANDEFDDSEDESDLNPEQENIAHKTAQKVKEHIDDSMQTQELHNTSTQVELNEQKQRIEGVHKSVDSLHTKMDLTPQMSMQTASQINAIEKRINSISKELAELKGNNNAMLSLMKKMIETNRQILNSLKK